MQRSSIRHSQYKFLFQAMYIEIEFDGVTCKKKNNPNHMKAHMILFNNVCTQYTTHYTRSVRKQSPHVFEVHYFSVVGALIDSTMVFV